MLLEHSDFLTDIQELFAKQLEEMQRVQKSVLELGFILDELIEWTSWMEEESGKGNVGARNI